MFDFPEELITNCLDSGFRQKGKVYKKNKIIAIGFHNELGDVVIAPNKNYRSKTAKRIVKEMPLNKRNNMIKKLSDKERDIEFQKLRAIKQEINNGLYDELTR